MGPVIIPLPEEEAWVVLLPVPWVPCISVSAFARVPVMPETSVFA